MKTAVLSLIIAMLVAILSIFQFDRYQNFTADTEQSITKLNEKIDSRVAALNQKMDTLEKALTDAGIDQVTDASSSQVTKPEPPQMTTTASDVKEALAINSAYNLSHLAAIQLQMNNDVQNALTLLHEAAAALQPLPKDKAEPLRQALNHQIAKLQALKTVNITELWEKLGGMIEQIHTLPIRGDRNIQVKPPKESKINKATSKGKTKHSVQAEHPSTVEPEHPEEQEAPKGWRKALGSTWEDIKSLIKIQRHTKPIEPLLSIAEQQLAYENLTLLLEQARWATVTRNQVIYQQTLQQAKLLLANHFATDDVRVDSFGEQLEELSKINLKPEMPDLKSLLSLFLKTGDQ